MKRCYYEVLGVEKGAGDDAIRKAYNALAMKHHPDRNPGDAEAEATFKLVVEAYTVLRDPQKRQVYDRYGHAGLEGAGGGAGMGDDLMDMLREAFSMFGGGGRRQRGPRSGADLQVQFEISLLEAYQGVTREFQVPRHEPCGTCKGTGAKPGTKAAPCRRCNGQGAVGSFLFAQACPSCRGKGATIADPCKDCRGQGQIETEHAVSVDIPAGVDDGMSVVVRGAGENGEPGGQPGDLYCLVRVKGHPLFARDGQALHTEVPLSFAQAALGARIDVPTLEGKAVTLAVPKGSNSGDEVRVTGKGMPHVRGGRQGDLVVHLRVETPRNLTPRQEELLRELGELEGKNPAPARKSWLERIAEFFTSPAKSEGKK
ncbi:MAG: molecular chaperone DnaJ [Gemmataceae bacterium]|nr:molecular chaperone DnaJ [Gemmataceae bacterium]